jgi:hypothetical protein
MSGIEGNCTLLVATPDRAVATAAELQAELESQDAARKVGRPGRPSVAPPQHAALEATAPSAASTDWLYHAVAVRPVPQIPRLLQVAALKKAIVMLLSGEDAPRMLMTVIRYCITVEDHTLQVRMVRQGGSAAGAPWVSRWRPTHRPRGPSLLPCDAQKLLMLYYEVVRKYDAAGKLLPEMILVWCVGTPGVAS